MPQPSVVTRASETVAPVRRRPTTTLWGAVTADPGVRAQEVAAVNRSISRNDVGLVCKRVIAIMAP